MTAHAANIGPFPFSTSQHVDRLPTCPGQDAIPSYVCLRQDTILSYEPVFGRVGILGPRLATAVLSEKSRRPRKCL